MAIVASTFNAQTHILSIYLLIQKREACIHSLLSPLVDGCLWDVDSPLLPGCTRVSVGGEVPRSLPCVLPGKPRGKPCLPQPGCCYLLSLEWAAQKYIHHQCLEDPSRIKPHVSPAHSFLRPLVPSLTLSRSFHLLPGIVS